MTLRLRRILLCAVLAYSLGGGGLSFSLPLTECPPGTTLSDGLCHFFSHTEFITMIQGVQGPEWHFTGAYAGQLAVFLLPGRPWMSTYNPDLGWSLYPPSTVCTWAGVCDGSYMIAQSSEFSGVANWFEWIPSSTFVSFAPIDPGGGGPDPEPTPEPAVQGSTVSVVYISTAVLAQMSNALNPGIWKNFTGGDLSFWFGLAVGFAAIWGFKAGGMS